MWINILAAIVFGLFFAVPLIAAVVKKNQQRARAKRARVEPRERSYFGGQPHPSYQRARINLATRSLIAQITADAMAEEWIDEVRSQLPVPVQVRLKTKLRKNRLDEKRL